MNKVAISTAIGVGAGLALAAAYVGAPYVGVYLTPTTVMVSAAVVAFGASIALLTMTVLIKPEKKKAPSTRRLRDLGKDEFAHFPTGGVRIVVKPDSVIEELDVVRSPSSYTKKDIILTIKKSSGKAVFNPVLLKRLFVALKDFENFVHILLVNEHDEYIGYMPAAYARAFLVGSDAESRIVKYIVDVLANPGYSIVLRDINGLSIRECISDDDLVSAAQKRVTDDHLRGLVVFKDRRNRKPLGVIYEEDLVKLTMRNAD
ncbi:MAG: hypothetical protein ABSD21_11970 [Rhizomicrobium sp.]|jgi:hypothetical protein